MLYAFFLLCFLWELPSLGWAQVYRPMKMVRPVAPGEAGVGLDTSNRVHPSATGTYGPITVTVSDMDGNQVSGTWSITVTSQIGADGFCFVDAVNGIDSTGNGSLASPFQGLGGAWNGCGTRSIIYFKNGTYTFPQSLISNNRVEWSEGNRGIIWIAFPGHHPIVDFEADGSYNNRFFVNVQGRNAWFDGLKFRNIHSIGFRFQNRQLNYGVVIRNVTAVNLREGADGENSSFFMWTTCTDCTGKFDTVQNSAFSNILSNGVALKLYAVEDAIFETSTYANNLAGGNAILAIKGGLLPNETVRANIMTSQIDIGIGGNMTNFSGEIYHNLVIHSTTPGSWNGALTLGVAQVQPPAVKRLDSIGG